MHRGMISFTEDEKLDYEREWEKIICMIPWEQENSDVVQVQETLQMKVEYPEIYFLKILFDSMSLEVTLRCMHTSVQATDPEKSRWESQRKCKQEGTN